MTLDDFYKRVQAFDAAFESKNDFGLRLGLINEELGEVCEAHFKKHGVEKESQELCDLLFVVLGWFDVAGYDLGKALQYIADKNDKKINNKHLMSITKEGRIVKPDDQASMILDQYHEIGCIRDHKCAKEGQGPCNGLPKPFVHEYFKDASFYGEASYNKGKGYTRQG